MKSQPMATRSISSSTCPLLLLLLSLPVLIFFLSPRHHLPISSPDDDLSLFHKAAANLSRHHLPSATSRLSAPLLRPKLAFLFLTNSPLHFAPLWDRFFFAAASPLRYNIYIHADPSAHIPQPAAGVFKNRIIRSEKTQRSSPTLISAARRLLATAVLDDPANAYFALLSQTCIPLHSFNHLYDSLFDPSQLKFLSYIEILDKEPTLWERYNARGENVMLPEVRFDEFRVGSHFFVLNRKHALMVIEDTRLWSKFKLPCLDVHTCYPEEHYFPTMLSMRDLSGCTRYTLTNVNWTGSVNGHPHTYGPREVSPALIHSLRESNSSFSYMFARKFSPDCLPGLMDIADSVIFKD